MLILTKGLGRGGTERLVAGTVRHLDPERFTVEVAYLLPWKDGFVDEIEANGTPVHCLGAPRRRRSGPLWAARLRRLVRAHDIDLVHTHMPLSAAVARLALPRRRPVLVHTEHNLWDRYRLPTRLANRLTYGRNAAAIAVSDTVAAQIRSRRPVEVITHGIDLVRRRPPVAQHLGQPGEPGDMLPGGANARLEARRRLGIEPEVPVIGTVGNFTAKKDHAVLLAAAARLVGEHPDLRLVLVGSGPLEADLRARAQALGLGHVALFAGSRGDVYSVLPAFDLFTLSSRFEGLPIALLEAMASGICPVATRVGGIPEVIGDGTCGLLVPPGDAAALAQALGKLLADPERRQAFARQATIRAADFDLSHAVRRIEAIYDAALGVNRAHTTGEAHRPGPADRTSPTDGGGGTDRARRAVADDSVNRVT